MEHKMRLYNGPFEKMINGTKKVELRLYDEKRKLINVGDIIEFENRLTQEKINVKVVGVHIFNNFEELYQNYDKISIGYDEDEYADPCDMEEFYSKEEQAQYGVVGIEINLIK